MAFVGHEVALLFVKVTAWVSPRGIQASAHDLLYAPNRVLATVSQAVQTQGGQHGSFDNDGAGALFRLDSDLPTAWGQAWQAAAAAERELLALNSQLPGELGIEVRLAMAPHAGTAAIGPLHWGAGHARLPVGPAVCDAMALRDLAAARGAWPAVSRTAAASSWPTDELAWQPVAPPEGHNGATLEAALLPSVGDATHGATHGATHVATRAARPHLSPFSPAGRLNVASASGLFAPVAASRHALRPWGC